ICNTTRKNKAANLAIKCRKIAEKWINFITRSIHTISPSALDEVENLRLKMVTVYNLDDQAEESIYKLHLRIQLVW
ncbi:unnamed protein product, partial [Rotaria sordida]